MRVSVRPLELVYVSPHHQGGHLFLDRRTGARVHYGPAAFVDALGGRTPVTEAWEGEQLVLTIPEDLVDGAAYPAVLDPVVSAEVPLDVTGTGGPWGNQTRPWVAFDSTNFLVVWSDLRPGLTTVGARVTPAGGLIDPRGFPISSQHSLVTGLVFDGTSYLLTWANGWSIRVTPAGSVFGLNNSLEGLSVTAPSLAFDGTNSLAVWSAEPSPRTYTLEGTRVTPGGAVLDRPAIRIATSSVPLVQPKAACALAVCLVAFQVLRQSWPNPRTEIHAVRVSAGTVLDVTPIVVASTTEPRWNPSVAADGSQFIVVFTRTFGNRSDLEFVRIGPNGTPLDAAPITLSSPPANSSDEESRVVFDGSAYAVSWRRDDWRDGSASLHFSRVSPAGVVLNPSGVLVSGTVRASSTSHLAVGGSMALMVWDDGRSEVDDDIYAARIDSSGAVLDPPGFLLSVTASTQRWPAATWNGLNYVVGWTDNRSGRYEVHATRVNRSGVVVGPNSIGLGPASGNAFGLAVTSLDSTSLFAWNLPTGGTQVRRVAVDGSALDPAPLSVFSGSFAVRPSVATDGTGYLVASAGSGTLAARISAGGQLLDASPLALGSGVFSQAGAVAFDGANYLVTWTQSDSFGGLSGFIARVTPSGGVLDPAGVLLLPDVSAIAQSMAFDGTNLLAVSEPNGPLVANRFTTTLQRIGPELRPEPRSVAQGEPTVAFNGSEYTIAWTARSDAGSDINSVRVTPGGNVLDIGGFALASGPPDEGNAALAAGPAGELLLVYERYEPSPMAATRRVFARVVWPSTGTGPPGAPCSAGSECQSAFCVDQVCCSSACPGGLSDCQACSTAAGGQADGTCTLIVAGRVCRAPANTCDAAEVCAGQPLCPLDLPLPAGTPCLGGVCQSGVCRAPDGGLIENDGGIDGGSNGGLDGGSTDGGSTADGGSDGGQADAGENDAGRGAPDSGVSDAGAEASGDVRRLTLGCGCTGPDGPPWSLAGLLLAGAWARRRRHVSRPRKWWLLARPRA